MDDSNGIIYIIVTVSFIIALTSLISMMYLDTRVTHLESVTFGSSRCVK